MTMENAVIHIRASEEMVDWIKARSQEMEITASDYIRDLIESDWATIAMEREKAS